MSRATEVRRAPSSARPRFTIAGGAALALLGAIIPASEFIDALGGNGTETAGAAHLGAVLFKLGLVMLGLSVVGVGALPLAVAAPQPSGRTVTALRKWEWMTLLVILAVCVLLCFHRLGDALWFDEIATYVHYARLPLAQILTTYDDQNQHILYSVLAHAAFVAFGEGAWALRLPAALLGVGSVWALFLLARQVASTREALLASALLGVSYQLIWFSQNARGYTGLLFLTLLSSWLFVRGLREARPHLWLLYAVTVALGTYIHMTMLFVVAGHFIQYCAACLIGRRQAWAQRWSVLLYGFGLAALLTFQLYALVVPQVLTAFAHAQVLGSTWTQPWWAVLEFARGLRLTLSGSVMALTGMGVFVAGLLGFARTEPDLVQLLVLPILICLAVKYGMGHHLWPRSFFFAAGFLVLVVIRGATVLGAAAAQWLRPRSSAAVAFGTALSLAMILAAARSVPFAYGPKQDFAGALAFVQARKEAGDALVTVGLTVLPYRTLYPAGAEEVRNVEALDAVRARARRTWLLYTLPFQLADADPALMRSIEQNFVVQKQFAGTLGGGAVFVCRSDHPAP